MLTSARFWLGLAVTVIFIGLLFFEFDFGEMRFHSRFDLAAIRDALANANYLLLLPSIAVYFVSLYFRSQRWRYLLSPFADVKTVRLYPVVTVGYMANNVLPMRLGELVRSYYLSTRETVRGSTALASILIERVFDGLALLFILAATAVFLPVSGLAEKVSETASLPVWVIIPVVVLPFVSVLSLMVAAALYPQKFVAFVEKLSRLAPERFHEPLSGAATRFIAGFEGLHRPMRLASVFLLTLPIWAAEGTMYYIIALAFGLDSVFDSFGTMLAAMLVLTSLSNLATSIPSSPGAVGPFEFFAWLGLVFLGADPEVATAYALILHLALLLPVIAAGFLHLAYRGISITELTKARARNIAEGER